MDAGLARKVRKHPILHFTHTRNLEGIFSDGYLKSDNLVDRTHELRVEAADLDVKARRRMTSVPLAPFGCVADYVPFYFGPRSPMLYVLHKGSVPNYQEGQDPLVYLVSTVEAVVDARKPCLFSDGNCAHAVTQFFGDIGLLDSAVDWEVMRAKMWANTAEDPDRMRRRMAEFLVYERLETQHLTEIAVRAPDIRRRVEAQLTKLEATLPVVVRPGWYY